jgi:hypothetical protein
MGASIPASPCEKNTKHRDDYAALHAIQPDLPSIINLIRQSSSNRSSGTSPGKKPRLRPRPRA